jgi:hypothetical protein
VFEHREARRALLVGRVSGRCGDRGVGGTRWRAGRGRRW